MQKTNPFSLFMDSWQLGLEAWTVIGLRIPRLLAGNPAAAREAHLMIAEKIEAMGVLQWRAMTGDLGTSPDAAMRGNRPLSQSRWPQSATSRPAEKMTQPSLFDAPLIRQGR